MQMRSLRKELLMWLLSLYVGAAIVAAVCTYLMYGWAANEFMDNQMRAFAEAHAAAGSPLRAPAQLNDYDVHHEGDLIVQLWDRGDRLVTNTWPQFDFPRQASDGFHELAGEEGPWRLYTLRSPDRTVQVVQSIHFRRHVIHDQALQSGLPIALLIPASAIVLWWAIGAVMRRLEAVARAASAQDEHTLSELPVEGVPCEIRPFVQAVNTLLGRLRQAFVAQRRFVQDAAHELRTPITAMSLQLENLKAKVRDAAAEEEVAQLEAGLARTRRLVEQLLRLARQESPRPLESTTVRLDELLKETLSAFVPIADRRRIDLGFTTSIAVSVEADRDDLRSLIHNLLDNALRYSPEGGVVDVALHNDANDVSVEIIDNGPGVAPDLLPRLFDRFFRIEGSDAPGSGLGLAIAKHAAERNHIELELLNRVDGSGLIARMRFKAATIVAAPSMDEPDAGWRAPPQSAPEPQVG